MIDQKAREIVASQYPEMRPSYKGRRLTIARLGIIEGLEMAAKVADAWDDSPTGYRIAKDIRALIEEQKE